VHVAVAISARGPLDRGRTRLKGSPPFHASEAGPRDRPRPRARRGRTPRSKFEIDDSIFELPEFISSADRECRGNAEVGSRVAGAAAPRPSALPASLRSVATCLAPNSCSRDAEPSWRCAGRGPRRARERSERRRSPSTLHLADGREPRRRATGAHGGHRADRARRRHSGAELDDNVRPSSAACG
jgi:hypothetical protein